MADDGVWTRGPVMDSAVERFSATVECIKVELGTRYILIVKIDMPLADHEAQLIRESLQSELHTWWESGDKFLPLIISGSCPIEVTLERVEGDLDAV